MDKKLAHIVHHILHEDANPLCTEYVKTHEAIQEQLAKANAQVTRLTNSVAKMIRENCSHCDNGVADIQENIIYDEDGEVDEFEITEIECQYCGEEIEALQKDQPEDVPE